jgi:preprotein translocase subunit SecG
MQTALIIIHVIISIVLVAVVLMQHGKQQGLSGAIAGGAETFFGKNKGRTIDAALKKVTSVVALLFVVSSIALAVNSINANKSENVENNTETTQQQVEAQPTQDKDGNLVDENGNILMTAEELQKQLEAATKKADSSEKAE